MSELHNLRLPAGWYPDPDGAEHRRWWDGKTWTQHTAPFQRPAPVYDFDDRAEADRPHESRRVRRGAKLGASLAALAHRIPVPRLRRRGQHSDDA